MSLHSALLDAHSRDDKAALVTLYSQAADQAGSVDERCYFLTQAYIYALDCAHPNAASLQDALAAQSRI